MLKSTAPEAFNTMLTSGRIGADDVLALRRNVFPDGVISRDEAEWLLALDEVCEGESDDWPVFFVEALTDHLVNQAEPLGYVSEENARWLIGHIGAGGVVKTRTGLELLMKVIETAQSCPESLAGFALAQVKSAVVEGAGPAASGRALKAGAVDEADVGMLRRVLYGFGGSGNIAVTRSEAEVLFDINDATMDADNHPSWDDLFVKAIANHLMAAHGYRVPTREVALKRAAWLDDERSGVDKFIVKALAGGLKGIWQAYRQPDSDAWESRVAAQAGEAAASEPVLGSEAQWLAQRINRNGRICNNERALLTFLAEESPAIDPALKPLMEKAGIAA